MAKRFRFVPVWKKNPERTAGTRPLHVSLAHPNLSATKTFPDAQNFNNIFPGTLGTLCDVFISEVAAVMVGTFEDLNCWSGFLTLNADTFAIKHWQLQFGDCFGFVVETWFSLANVSVCVCVRVCVYVCLCVRGMLVERISCRSSQFFHAILTFRILLVCITSNEFRPWQCMLFGARSGLPWGALNLMVVMMIIVIGMTMVCHQPVLMDFRRTWHRQKLHKLQFANPTIFDM